MSIDKKLDNPGTGDLVKPFTHLSDTGTIDPTTTGQTVCSITLTPGTWFIWGAVQYSGPASSQRVKAWIESGTTANPNLAFGIKQISQDVVSSNGETAFSIPGAVVSVGSDTNYKLRGLTHVDVGPIFQGFIHAIKIS
jgi:hypothetical protein